MLILFTGISGSGRSSHSSSLAKMAESKGFEIQIKFVGQMMYEKSESLGYPIENGRILNLPKSTLRSLRWAVFEDIMRTKDEIEHTIIDTHVSFRWDKYLLEAFDYLYLEKLNPDIYFTITDNLYSIYGRLKDTPGWMNRNSLLDLIVWRDEERFLTRTFAKMQNKKHYLICNEEPYENVYRLAFEPETKKTYLSYPISAASEKELDEVSKFKDALNRNMVVFDPMSLKDIEWCNKAETLLGKGIEYIESPPFDSPKPKRIKVETRKIVEVKSYLQDQTISRDYNLIDQSDYVIVNYYNPLLPSPGVQREIKYAKENGKDVYLFWPRERLSPFLIHDITRHFQSQKDLLEFIDNL